MNSKPRGWSEVPNSPWSWSRSINEFNIEMSYQGQIKRELNGDKQQDNGWVQAVPYLYFLWFVQCSCGKYLSATHINVNRRTGMNENNHNILFQEVCWILDLPVLNFCVMFENIMSQLLKWLYNKNFLINAYAMVSQCHLWWLISKHTILVTPMYNLCD